MNGAPLTRTPPRRSWGAARAATPGVAANSGASVDVSSILRSDICAETTGRVPGLRGAFIIASTPCSCVGIGDQHSGIVIDCSKSSRDSVAFLARRLLASPASLSVSRTFSPVYRTTGANLQANELSSQSHHRTLPFYYPEYLYTPRNSTHPGAFQWPGARSREAAASSCSTQPQGVGLACFTAAASLF